MDTLTLTETAKAVRRKMLIAASNAGRGHLGGAFSCVEILVSLFKDYELCKNDKFVLSKGHAAIALYALLIDDISSFCKDGSTLAEHPSSLIPEINLTTGALGHGIGLASGLALANKLNGNDGRVFVLVGDGECMEGSVYEALLFGVERDLTNLTVIVDKNGLMSTALTPKRFSIKDICRGIGCMTVEINGHDFQQLRSSLEERWFGGPNVIIARTVKGMGVSFMENNVEWHAGVPKGAQLELALKELE